MEDANDALLASTLLAWLAVRSKKIHEGPGLSLNEIAGSLAQTMDQEPKQAGTVLLRCLQSLHGRGLVEVSQPSRKNVQPKWRLSGSGRKAALDVLGVTSLPQRGRVDWPWARKLLLCRALGQPLPAALSHAGKADWMAAWFLARHHRIDGTDGATPARVLTVLAARAAGARPGVRLDRVNAFSLLVLRAGAATPPAFRLEDFARQVNDAARGATTGRWLEDRVFIVHVWKEAQRRGELAGMPFSEFQGHLIEAHRARLVRLSRGDLIAALPRDDVRASETEDGEATFHFVKLDRPQPEGGQQ